MNFLKIQRISLSLNQQYVEYIKYLSQYGNTALKKGNMIIDQAYKQSNNYDNTQTFGVNWPQVNIEKIF